MGGRGRGKVVVVALAGAALVAGTGFGLEAAALPRPSHGLLVAVDALHELDQYRFVRSVDVLAGRRVDGTCFQGWFRVPGHRRAERGAAAVLATGDRIVGVGPRIWTSGRGPSERRASTTLLRLACPQILGGVLAHALARGRVTVENATRRAYTVGFGLRRQHVEFVVSGSTLRPLAIRISGRHGTFSASLAVGATRTEIRHVLRTLRTGGHEHAIPA